MRFEGTLIRWNEERGFGFIRVTPGNQEIFVHVSGFARDGGRPAIGEILTFELETASDGRRRAVRVLRPAQAPTARRIERTVRRQPRSHLARHILIIALLIGVAGLGLRVIAPGVAGGRFSWGAAPEAGTAQSMPTSNSSDARFQCDGRIYCSQMTSCDEAKYFLKSCPGTQMDGDNDGVPCEQQWCTSAR